MQKLLTVNKLFEGLVFWAPIRAFRSKSSAKTAVYATAGKELLPSLLPAGVHWRFSLRAFRYNRGRSASGKKKLVISKDFLWKPPACKY
jgi:hypothetical protein